MNSIKISIIVPIYNTEDYLRECIDSLINQTLKDIEIILIDDGSTDSSGKICDEYAKKNKNMTVIHQSNAGQSVARNNGVKIAKGEYIQYVDSDDYIVPDACATLYSAAKSCDADIVRGDLFNNHKGMENSCEIEFENEPISAAEYMVLSMDNNMYDIVTWLDIVKREVLNKYNISFMEGVFYEDHEYMMKLLANTNINLLKIHFPFYYYRPNRKGSTTNVHKLKKGSDMLKVINKMMWLSKNVNIDMKYKKYMESIVAMAVYHLSQIWVKMSSDDRKIIYKSINSEVKKYALKTDKLTNRMKIQNRLFLYAPNILHTILVLRN